MEFRRWRWPFETATCEVLPYRPASLDRAALSPNGELLAPVFFGPRKKSGPGVAARTEISSIAAHAPADLQFSPDGSLLAITGPRGFIVPVPLGGDLGPVPSPQHRR